MVRVPTMGLYGTGDVALAEDQMTRSADWVERPWRYERLPGIGHWLQIETPDTVDRLLVDWVSGTD